MKKNANSDAILLLTTHFSDSSKNEEQPLNIREWASLLKLLAENRRKDVLPKEPKDFLKDSNALLEQVENKIGISKKRLTYLLNRGSGLAMMKSKWNSTALWFVTRADEEYPKSLKTQMKAFAPPVIYGCGDKKRLQDRILGLLGDINQYPAELIQSLNSKGISSLSELPPSAAPEELPSIGIVFGELLQEATSLKYRKAIREEELTLICFTSPESSQEIRELNKGHKYLLNLAEKFLCVTDSDKISEYANNTWIYVKGFRNNEGKIVLQDSCEELMHRDGEPNQIGFSGESGNLLPIETSLSLEELEALKKDRFHQFMLSFLEQPTTFDELVQAISSTSLSKRAIKKWLKLAEGKGLVITKRKKRKKAYVRY